MQRRRRTRPTTSFEQRLSDAAKALRERAKRLPPGPERENLLRQARQAETAAHINQWLSSPGLASPK
ncbi:hypothetical protein [Bradyrhizobium sp.]|uniref:hypothetical protein n=1 Tax=Bradyrhizobium sp. TaxID=376 RepID=UPI003C63CCD8